MKETCIQSLESHARPRLIVIYIGGLGRSGSTLLAELLATQPGFVSVGELPTLWRHGWRDDWQSSDGHQFSTSPVWKALLLRLQRENNGFRPELAMQLCEDIAKDRHMFAWRAGKFGGAKNDMQSEYTEHFAKVYRILADETNARVIVDSGKVPFHASLMSGDPDLDFRSIHLVRDPRAVAFSRMRRKVNRNAKSTLPILMVRQGPVRIALRWNWQNILMNRLQLSRKSGIRLHYEALANNPADEIARALSELDVPYSQDALNALRSRTFVKRPGIAFSGNSSRFDLEETSIKLDDAWRGALPWWSCAVVSALTYPVRCWLNPVRSSKCSTRTNA